MTHKRSVLIIGAGIVGLACAELFARKGTNVTLLDRHLPGAGQTTRTGGGIRLAHGSDLNVRLTLRSLPVWERFTDLFGVDIDYVETGHLFLTASAAQLDAFGAQATLLGRHAVASTVMDKSQISKRWPYLDDLSSSGGLYCSAGGYVNHHRVVDGYLRALLHLGVTIELGCRVEDLIQQAGKVIGVKTSDGEVFADIVINAAGPAAGRLTARAGARDPFVSRRHELLIVRPKRPVDANMPWLIDVDRQVHVRPDGDGRALIGGFLGHDAATDPERYEQSYSNTWASQVREAAHRAFGLIEPDCEIVTGWAGLYPGTSDYLPVAEVTWPGMVTIAGLSGTGLMHAPAMAEIAWDLAHAVETPWLDTAVLNSRRFDGATQQLERTGF
ncbi:MAG: FAD-dependent oxidoreductase [Pseudomonadota bacterium]